MKGESTRTTILEAALDLARTEGLDAISIGRLAKGVGLSKSGLFSHFKSKQRLQLEVLETAADAFVDAVVRPALVEPRGEPRLRAMFESWLRWADAANQGGGCVFLGAATEYDDRPGDVRDYLVRTQRDWLETLARAVRLCQAEGHLRADLEPEQVAFEIYGLMMAFHLYRRLLGDDRAGRRARSAFETLLRGAR
jgi:AcrR family transcriptional regulator